MNEISKIIGKTAISYTETDGKLILAFDDKTQIKFYHDQDCCESVEIDQIDGDLNSLIGKPLLMAEIAESDGEAKNTGYYGDDSWTWTFLKLATSNGYVTVKWYGSSNGYYSESVDYVLEEV